MIFVCSKSLRGNQFFKILFCLIPDPLIYFYSMVSFRIFHKIQVRNYQIHPFFDEQDALVRKSTIAILIFFG